MSALEILADAQALLADPARWTRGALARDAEQRPVRVQHDSAVAWSAVGAMERVSGTYRQFHGALRVLLHEIALMGFLGGADAYNDAPERTHAEIASLFARAIETARESEGK